MKPEYEKIAHKPQHSFSVRIIERDSRPFLSKAWHYHSEIEICYTEKSWGRRFVGNQIADYYEDDLVIFGENLPHGFITTRPCNQIVIQFHKDFFGKEIIDKPEYAKIAQLLDTARAGLEYFGKDKRKAIKLIKKIVKSEGLEKLILLLRLLNVLSKSSDHSVICSKEYVAKIGESSLGRMKKIYDFIIDNYSQKINVGEVAGLINLSEASFYRFFKQHADKTFTAVINEFRVNHAIRLLLSTEKTIAQVCFESGFNNISYFNRKFKEIMDLTPSEFRSQTKEGFQLSMN